MRHARFGSPGDLPDAIRMHLCTTPGSTVRKFARTLEVRDARVGQVVAADSLIEALLTPDTGGKARRLYLASPSVESRSDSAGPVS
jgi:hypothetical protein